MLETELYDHIEKTNHSEDFRRLPLEEYRKWFEQNFLIEDRQMPPGQAAWLKEVHSFGVETRMRHA